jgi:hypothetical protein
MFAAIHSWLMAHPLTRELGWFLLTLFVTPILAARIPVVWKFLKIPPQRLNVWILKARLSATESRLEKVRKLGSDLPYLIVACTACLSLAILAGALLNLTYLMTMRQDVAPGLHGRLWNFLFLADKPVFYGTAIFSYLALLMFARDLLQIVGAINLPKKTTQKLLVRLDRLRASLVEKGISVEA